MSRPEEGQAVGPPSSPSPLSWPPPGLERLQGRIWRVITLAWLGAVVLILPLLWSLASDRAFWSLGPLEGNWPVQIVVAGLGLVVFTAAFATLFALLRDAGEAAETGYGSLTILETASDVGRDTGFLIQGRRHFSQLDVAYRATLVRARLRGAGFVLAAAIWLALGFALSVLLGARGFLTPSGIWLLTLGPTAGFLLLGFLFLWTQNLRVRSARQGWNAQEGEDKVEREARAWARRLDNAGESVALGAGGKGEAGRFRTGSMGVVLLFLVVVVPTGTIALTAAIGPILADIAIPDFLSVQEMAGATEVLRRYRIEPDPTIPPAESGAALHNLAFVGTDAAPDALEKEPATRYPGGWFPEPDIFPDPFSETVARDLTSRPLSSFDPDEQAALREAAAHPAQQEFELLARARLVDVVSGRWALPFPDSLTFQALPWPRFAAYRTAGLARVARAAVEFADGEAAAAEETLQELLSTGFLLVDQGPTLIDNLMGVVLVNMAADGLEGLYLQDGRSAEADALAWAREGAARAAHQARAGLVSDDIHSLLRGIPDLVLDDAPLRGLRWEYFATFNTLAPCINMHRMVFGPDESLTDWRLEARDALVQVRGEVDLFRVAQGASGSEPATERKGAVPRFLGFMLGGSGSPGSCASLIGSLEAGEAL